jgi:hypothetical protein
MLSIRPKVAEHALFVLGRSIHPELLTLHRSRTYERANYKARIDITSDGHVVTFSSAQSTVTEVVCSAQQQLPQKRRMAAHLFRNRTARMVETRRNIEYQIEYQLEQVGPGVFWMVHQQLANEPDEHDLLQNFGSSGRIPMGAISFVHVEQRERQFLVQALHTFPDDYLILKSFSTFSVEA